MGELCSTGKKIKIKIYNSQEIMKILDEEDTRKNLESISIQLRNSVLNLFLIIDSQMTIIKQKLLFESDRSIAHNTLHKYLRILINSYYIPFQQNFLNVAFPMLELCVVKVRSLFKQILIESYLAIKTLNSKQEIWWNSNYFQIRKRVLIQEFKMDVKSQKPSIEAPFIEYLQLLIDIIEVQLNSACVFNLQEKKNIQQISESHTGTNIFYSELKRNIEL
ncbi:unnamed protein product (macronuclear) [Paramecium tetraurelia]|uniref:Uncharacterized protein n=1 Tax=Paramecium tetraurelia TaxID=5888 RepID=A0D795_PARTE|nr:uncharacterized protein GSPATT00001954001 [Paramecium tetraurelia]CAK78912.1 unnamed protein product [Paramecium tetraurelia]|eukprot:XP_001446309.1 hypothetical protein (macronuclear) [Paramecium tetraurelia strain d4-2]